MSKQSDALKLEIKGLKELQAKAIQMIRDMEGTEIANAMRDSVIIMQRRAMKGPPKLPGQKYARLGAGTTPTGFVPVDTGRLRASLTPKIARSGKELRGIVGTNVVYAPFQEAGTKRGVRALWYLKTTLSEVRDQIQGKFDRAMARIVKKRPA